jgi:S1-C subfamily serine protease
MRQFLYRIFFFFIVVATLSSCATLISRKTVYVSSKDDKASVYVNDIYTSEYAGASIYKHRPCIVTTTRAGYKTKSTIIKPTRFDPNVFVTAIPPALILFSNAGEVDGTVISYGLIAGLDYLIAGNMHRRNYVVDELEKLPVSDYNDVFVKMKADLDSIRIDKFNVHFYDKLKDWSKSKDSHPVNIEDYIEAPAYWLNNTLDDLGYQNSQSEIIQNYDKCLSVDLKILEAHENRVKQFGTSLKLTTRFTFCDIFGNALNFVDVKSESALFSNGYYLLLYQRESCLRDALINGLAEAMKSDEFTALYNRTREAFNNTYSKGDSTPLKAPLNSKPDFQNMANAQITIDGDGFHGSGCLISPDGLAITSHRVVGTKEEVDIIFSNGAKKKARVIKRDPVSNIVLISTDTTGVSSLKLSKSTSGRTGENVFCVGSPVNKALSQSISSGIVSGYREQNGVMFLQTDAKVSNGNNGSPIIDKNGFVIGIVNEKYIGAALEGLSFAVSAEDILNGLNLNTEY